MRVSQKEWIATKNRLEYLKDKADRQDKELDRYRRSLGELEEAAGILVKQVALTYGGEKHQIELPRYDDLDAWEADVKREDGKMTVTLNRKSAE